MNADLFAQPAGLLDFIAAAALVLLVLGFLIGRHRCRRREAQLRERIDSLENAGNKPENED